ncbi:HNH endonuclease [Streptomyces sp. NPDC054833]
MISGYGLRNPRSDCGSPRLVIPSASPRPCGRRRFRYASVEDTASARGCQGPVRPELGRGTHLSPSAPPSSPSVHHLVEIVAGGTDTLDNIALAHQFCNSDSYNWGQKAALAAAERLADRVLHGKHGPGRRGRVPDADAVALAAEITGGIDD